MSDTRTDQRQQTRPTADMREDGMPEGQAPAVQERAAPPMTAVQRAAKERLQARDRVIAAVRHGRQDFESLLAPLGVDFDFFVAGLTIGLNKAMKADDKFFEAATASIIQAALAIARIGLIADGKQAAIVRYATEAQAMPMIEGWVEVLNASGLVLDINHDVVMEGDHFDYRQGDEGFIDHRPKLNRDIDGKVAGAWCIVRTKAGGRYAEVTDQKSLEKIRSVARAGKGPRSFWGAEMDRKAPFRRLVKRLPKNRRLEALSMMEDGNYDLQLGSPAGRAVARAAPQRVPVRGMFGRRGLEEVQDEQEDRRVDEGGAVESSGKPEPQAEAAGNEAADGRSGSGDAGSDQTDQSDAAGLDDEAVIDAVVERINSAQTKQELDAVWNEELDGSAAERFSGMTMDLLMEAGNDRMQELTGTQATTVESKEEAPQDEQVIETKKAEPEPQTSEGRSDAPALSLELRLAPNLKPRSYEDPKVWASTILGKLQTGANDATKGFWERNREGISAALNGAPELKELAERIEKVGGDMGFKL